MYTHHPPPTTPVRVTTFLGTGSLQIEYELDGYLPQAQCPLPLIKDKNNDFESALNVLLWVNLCVPGRLADHSTTLKGEYNAEMISQIENYPQFIRS